MQRVSVCTPGVSCRVSTKRLGVESLSSVPAGWPSTNTAVKVVLRNFSDEFLDYYLRTAGDGICSSVGAYYLEELGAQLIERVEGDYFSVLGLPILPLFEFLRSCGELKK